MVNDYMSKKWRLEYASSYEGMGTHGTNFPERISSKSVWVLFYRVENMSLRKKLHTWLLRPKLRVRSEVLRPMHLEPRTLFLSARNTRVLLEYFNLLDCHKLRFLNDIQFSNLLRRITDLSQRQIAKIFDLFDTDFSGRIDFDEFYFLMCVLISHKDSIEKQFLYRHSHIIFQLMDVDGSGYLSDGELRQWGFIFGLHRTHVRRVIRRYTILNYKELWFEDFLFFTEEAAKKHKSRLIAIPSEYKL